MTKKQIWFVTGSQHLYGPETLKQVEQNSKEIARHLSGQTRCNVEIIFKSLVTTPDEIYATLQQANGASECIGLIAWMHTFSPAQMWIRGLAELKKPLLHLHTQYNRDIPWDTIDKIGRASCRERV